MKFITVTLANGNLALIRATAIKVLYKTETGTAIDTGSELDYMAKESALVIENMIVAAEDQEAEKNLF